MSSPTDPNMGLYLPVPGVTTGPQWATENTANMTTIANHDHTTGKGVQIPVAALTVNADFSWLTFGLTNIGYAAFIDKVSTGNLTVNSSIGNVAGVPYWRDSAGNVKKILRTGDVGLSDLATIAANSVVGNSTGSAAVPTALPASAAGLAVLSAADAAAQRAALGIVNVTSMDTSALAYANSVCNFANPPWMTRIDFTDKASTTAPSGNKWKIGLGTSGTQTYPTTGGGGGMNLSTGASSTTMNGVTVTDTVFGDAWIPDLVLAASRWMVQWDFAFTSTPTANTYLFLGWIAADGSAYGPGVGVFGGGSTTKFGFAKHNVATFTNSTISIDANTHRVRMWANGSTPGQVFFAFDNETPISITGVTMGKVSAPYWEFKCTDVGAAQTCRLKTSYWVIDGELP